MDLLSSPRRTRLATLLSDRQMMYLAADLLPHRLEPVRIGDIETRRQELNAGRTGNNFSSYCVLTVERQLRVSVAG
ncbi:hypothetical protein BD410DRAFT_104514 [Rickenella mellea]|uniref:Uncharacterized protein n=1 Tax=Rickenella mellea TaxID=50990 RepID=A0A4Y7PJ94_9AGAM|nr:hypothetical protein BD410DRAFT_104514 [Rickenella mellea]